VLIAVLAIVLSCVAWLVIERMHHDDPAARATAWRWLMACVGAVLAVRVGMAGPLVLRVALVVFAIAAVVAWLIGRGHGGGGGDDGGEPPVDPDPDPGAGDRAPAPPQRLDPEAFDRARAEWEQSLKRSGDR
jgi:hypothetical protein